MGEGATRTKWKVTCRIPFISLRLATTPQGRLPTPSRSYRTENKLLDRKIGSQVSLDAGRRRKRRKKATEKEGAPSILSTLATETCCSSAVSSIICPADESRKPRFSKSWKCRNARIFAITSTFLPFRIFRWDCRDARILLAFLHF